MNHLELLVLCLVCCCVSGGKKAGVVTLKATPRTVISDMTPEVSLECRPSKSTESQVYTGLLLDVNRFDDTGEATLVARMFGNNFDLENNRTLVDGHLMVPDEDKSSFLSVTIKDPTFTEEGAYLCRYLYLDKDFNVKETAASVNITVVDISAPVYVPEEEPEVQADGVDCACDKIWMEIDALKAALAKKPDPLPQILPPVVSPVAQVQYGACDVSFSARFSKDSVPIRSESFAPFDDVISNKGGAFDAKKATFVAPCNGQYYFTVTLRSQQTMDSGYVDGSILVDGKEVARSSVFSDQPVNNYESAGNGVVVTLKPGQEVKVQIRTTSFGRFRGSNYSVFSGFFLHS